MPVFSVQGKRGGSCPVAVDDRSDQAAIDESRDSLMLFSWLINRQRPVSIPSSAQMKPSFIESPATVAPCIIICILILNCAFNRFHLFSSYHSIKTVYFMKSIILY